MADSRLSDLSAAASVGSTDLLYTVQTPGVGGVKATVQQLTTAVTGSTTINGATVTTSQPVLNLSQTWNAGAVTFTGLKFNVTDTTSASGSLLEDLQVGGVSKFSVAKDGTTTIADAYKLAVALNSYPTVQPTLMLDFANGLALDPRVAFTRSTTATYFNAQGVMQTAAINAPRFDFNPTTGESLGLLIEESRTNLLQQSQTFSAAAGWNLNGGSVVVTEASSAAPDGTTTANSVVENSANSEHFVAASPTFQVGTTYTSSVYVKQNSGSRNLMLMLYTNSASDQARVIVNPSTGAVVSAASAIGAMSNVSASVTSIGGSYYRVAITCTTSSTAGAGGLRFALCSGTSTSYTGDGTSGIYLWGAQLEAGSFATSYIPTVASQVTRAADVATMTGANFSSWYRADEGAIYAESSCLSADINAVSASISDGTINNRMELYVPAGPSLGTGKLWFLTTTSGVNVTSMVTGNVYTANTFAKTIGAYKVNDAAFVVNSATALTASSIDIPVVTKLNIGANYSGTSAAQNGHLKRLVYYPKRLTNTELQALTTA